MKHRRWHFPVLLLVGLAFLIGASKSWAQYEDGSLVGTIHDSTGAIIPGAKVTATNAGTGIISTAISTASGDYEVSLPSRRRLHRARRGAGLFGCRC